jgi:tetratricopeptide (TPR) repeat protein
MIDSPSNGEIRQFIAALRFSPEAAYQALAPNPDRFAPIAIRNADESDPRDAARIATLLQRFAREASDTGSLVAMLQAIPHGSPHLNMVAMETAQQIIRRSSGDDDDSMALRAETLSNLSERCEVEGDAPAGRMASEESVRLFRVLATRESRYAPKLVAALKYLAKRCSATGEHSQALAAAGEAVELAMNLATDEMGVRRVIDALDVLANRFSLAGDAASAWTTTLRAIEWLDLAAAQGIEASEERAMVRLRQSTLLTRLQRFEECLPLADEAALRMRELAHANPHSYAHLYMNAVDLAAGCRVKLGLPPSGEMLQGEARQFFEQLAEQHPRRYAPRLMKYLAWESAMIASTGSAEMALHLAAKAAELVPLVTTHHDGGHALDQGHVLMHLAELLRGAGKLEAASETVEAAMERYEAAGASHPVAASCREAAARFI